MSETLTTVERHSNPNVRVYHGRMQLTSKSIETHHRGDPNDNELAKIFLAIPGVTTVWLEPYKAQVQKAELYEWDEIEPLVLELLELQHGLA